MVVTDPEPITVEVVGAFDLGLVVQDTEGRIGQLRLPDMSPEQAKVHVAGRDREQLGRSLSVFVTWRWSGGCRVSEHSPAERQALADAEAARVKANADAEIGAVMVAVVRRAFEWGFLCDARDSPADGVLLTEAASDQGEAAAAAGCPPPPPFTLAVGAAVRVKVIGKNPSHGALVFGFWPPEA